MLSPFSILILENETVITNEISDRMVDYNCIIHRRSDMLSGIELATSTAINLIIIDTIFEKYAAWEVVVKIRSVNELSQTMVFACSDPLHDNTGFMLTRDGYTQVYPKPLPFLALGSAIYINQRN